jgi:hypothetical protein
MLAIPRCKLRGAACRYSWDCAPGFSGRIPLHRMGVPTRSSTSAGRGAAEGMSLGVREPRPLRQRDKSSMSAYCALMRYQYDRGCLP